eukprot:UN05646
MKSSLIVSLIMITLIPSMSCQDESPLTTIGTNTNTNTNTTTSTKGGSGSAGNETAEIQQDIASQDIDTDIISESESESETEEITGGRGVVIDWDDCSCNLWLYLLRTVIQFMRKGLSKKDWKIRILAIA